MDFLDNALDKAKEAFEIVSKKTEEVVSAQKQKYNIISLENKCSKHYEKLGRIFYDNLIDAEIEDPEIKELAKLITQNEEEIALLKEELNNLK